MLLLLLHVCFKTTLCSFCKMFCYLKLLLSTDCVQYGMGLVGFHTYYFKFVL